MPTRRITLRNGSRSGRKRIASPCHPGFAVSGGPRSTPRLSRDLWDPGGPGRIHDRQRAGGASLPRIGLSLPRGEATALSDADSLAVAVGKSLCCWREGHRTLLEALAQLN